MSSGPLLDLGAAITCPHGGHVQPVTANNRVLVGGVPALLLGDVFPVAGCPFETGTPAGAAPQPCTEVVWSAPAGRVLVDGRAVLLSTSAGRCVNAEHDPQGAPTVSEGPPRVVAQ